LELTKRKYKKAEVEEILGKYKEEFEQKLQEQRDKILDLEEENKRLIAQVVEYSKNEKSAFKALKKAEEKAEETEKKAEMSYVLEAERLKNFIDRFNGYFAYLIDKYPFYPEVVKANEIFNTVKNILGIDNGKGAVEKVKGVIETKNPVPFNPSARIEDYVSATSDNGFNINDVLNPGELKLEDLCKELGLMEEDE
jgi:sugar-specific transcriptional regulator TrmB